MTSSNNIIRRDRLTKLADKLADSRILYIQAPAGYGKTIFAGQWLEAQSGPTAMITLDEYDNTAEDFSHKLKRLLEGLHTDEDGAADLTKHPDFDKAITEFLMRAAAAMPRDMRGSIVIDDLHYLTDPSVLKILRIFLARLPMGIQICISSRNSLPECFSGLTLKNELKFISQEQMLFDCGEIYDLYKKRGMTITKKQAETVFSFTEGWPIGINALLLSEHQIPEESLPGDWLESFLKTHVWEMWDARSKEFMIGTCIEDELSISLCNALTGEGDSGILLERLLTEGAFLSRQRDGMYRFHRLFREFLRKIFDARPEEYRTKQIRIAGLWYREQNDFYHAVKRFSSIKDYEQMACCFDMLEEMDRAGFDAEQITHIVRNTLDQEIADRYPYLYFMMAFTARSEGRIDEFKNYADQYYQNYPRIVKRDPELAHNIFFLYIMDFRLTLSDIAGKAANAQVAGTFRGVRGSATFYFPLYHRSYRDFSELLPGDIDAGVTALAQILGPLLGEERAMLAGCIRAGLYYERGELQRAQELALSAAAELQSDFAPESKFCTMTLLMVIDHSMRQFHEEELVRKDIQAMIEEDKAFYLQSNFEALCCKNSLDSGDVTAARKWLESRGSDVYESLGFFKLYVHFTTARAYIVLGNFNQAIIILEKILEMCKALNRPIDVIEANLLLAISFWKKKRGNQKKALLYLEEAVKIAQPLEYEQVFKNEGAELKSMLFNLKNRTARSDYDGKLSGTFVGRLYFDAAEQALHSKGLTGGRVEETVRFTQQQKRVMKLMCEGYSYRKIAEALGIQFSTVRSHIELIYRKLDVSDMKEAILKIRQLDVLKSSKTYVQDGKKDHE